MNKRGLGTVRAQNGGAGLQAIRAIKTGQEIESGHYDVSLDVTRTWRHKWASFVANTWIRESGDDPCKVET